MKTMRTSVRIGMLLAMFALAACTPAATPTYPPPTPCRGDSCPTPTPMPPPPTPAAAVGGPRHDLPQPSEILLGADGKYFMPDRGDGCSWVERQRRVVPRGVREGQIEITLSSSCPSDFWWVYYPDSGEVFPLVSAVAGGK